MDSLHSSLNRYKGQGADRSTRSSSSQEQRQQKTTKLAAVKLIWIRLDHVASVLSEAHKQELRNNRGETKKTAVSSLLYEHLVLSSSQAHRWVQPVGHNDST